MLMPSTVIASFRYDQDARVLELTFVSGMTYNYKEVPEEIYLGLKSAREKGIYFNKFIRGKFQFEKK
jgi:hypothetical protein